jgi:hypothetical protein
MFNTIKVAFAVIIISFVDFAQSYPWNNNTREHLFGYIGNHNQAHAAIEDEGFRWKDDFSFIINGQQIQPVNWWFNGTVLYNPAIRVFSPKDGQGRQVSFLNNTTANFIHEHLSTIAWNVKTINACASASAAAVTIVVSYNGADYAFSKVISNGNRAYVATTNGAIGAELNYINDFPLAVRNNISHIIDCNIPNGPYHCTEGKILSILTSANLAIFKRTIVDLLLQAQHQVPAANFDYGSIRLVVLHVGTTMDPCAICTRCLVGISKSINENIDNFLRSMIHGVPAGNMNNAKFLVEVSSNGHYPTGAAFDAHGRLPNNRQDNFAAFNCGQCSHTECAGHDGGEANPINISLNFTSFSGLAIPFGRNTNWGLSRTFPPYVVFGRINPANHTIIPAPGFNANVEAHCPNRVGNVHQRHNCINNLPLVR